MRNMKEMVLMIGTNLSHPPENCCNENSSTCRSEACGSQASWSGAKEVDNHAALFTWISPLCIYIHCCPHQHLACFLGVESVSSLFVSVLCFLPCVSTLEYCDV
jgi:hypothetical protein